MQAACKINVGVFVPEWLRGIRREPGQLFAMHTPRECTICNYSGVFINAGHRKEARCPNCSSKERDRSIGLFLKQHAGGNYKPADKSILHFSAERPFFRQWKHYPGYIAGDIKKSKVANTVVDITKIQFPDESFDLIICNHVLEHVPDDMAGIKECFRVLKKGGIGIFSVPMDVKKKETWEPPADMPKEEVDRICGWDHVRIYGTDFKERLEAVGFTATHLTYPAELIQRHRLCAEEEERIYTVTKN